MCELGPIATRNLDEIGGRDALRTAGETPALQSESAIYKAGGDREGCEDRNQPAPEAVGRLDKLDADLADAGVDRDEDLAGVRLTLRGDRDSIYFNAPCWVIEEPQAELLGVGDFGGETLRLIGPGENADVRFVAANHGDERSVLVQVVGIDAGRDVFVGALVAAAILNGIVHLVDIGGVVPPGRLDTVPQNQEQSEYAGVE